MPNQISDFMTLPQIRVFTKWKKLKRYYKTMTGEDYPWPRSKTKGAEVTCISPDIAAVYIYPRMKKESIALRAATIAHECSHIVDEYYEAIGETKPGTECRAYLLDATIQAVLAQLGDEWLTRPA